MRENTFFHIRQILLCDHFRDIGFTHCVIGMKEKVRAIEKREKKLEKSHENLKELNFGLNDMKV